MTAVGDSPAELALRVAARNRAAATFARTSGHLSMSRAADALNAVMEPGQTWVRSDVGAGYVVHRGERPADALRNEAVAERRLPPFGSQACIDLFYIHGERIAATAAQAFAWARDRWLAQQRPAQSDGQSFAMNGALPCNEGASRAAVDAEAEAAQLPIPARRERLRA